MAAPAGTLPAGGGRFSFGGLMLTPGNHKLGGHLIWGFALPSGTAGVCVGMTPTCRRHCYAVRTEAYRHRAAARYRRNLALSRRKDFARRVRAFLVAHQVRVVRIHTGGEFYSACYAQQWLWVVWRSRRVRFFLYTRAWRVPEIKAVIDNLADLPNCQVWYSGDRDTGVPSDVPPRVRVAWLMAGEDDRPPAGADLVFRVQRLRRHPAVEVGGVRVCPTEDGRVHSPRQTCDRCGVCWRPPPVPDAPARIPLPMVAPP
jgi:Gene product 88